MACRLLIHTGDRPNAGTDSNVSIILHDENNCKTPKFFLDAFFRNDFERGEVCDFDVTIPEHLNFGTLKTIEVLRDDKGINPSWYVDKIVVEIGKQCFEFPVFKWIKVNRSYLIPHLDTSLPQFEPYSEQREQELRQKREAYKLRVKIPGLPAQISELPEDERFSTDYRWDMKMMKYQLALDTLIIRVKTGVWNDLESLKNVYITHHLPKPASTDNWTDDIHFANQRVADVNPVLIQLCTEIPEKFGVTDEMVSAFLEGLTLESAIGAKRLFIVDLHRLKGVPCSTKDLVVCAPIALFFENKDKQLVPVAIQLFQDKAPNNPVFLPSDDPVTWLLAKMWYNNADSAYHQALTHLGFTHLIMEGMSVITHRNLSQSHPIFKLLAPHFLYLIAINTLGIEALISEGGWIDKAQGTGIKGTFHLIANGLNWWRMDVDGTVPEDLRRRGLLDQSVLACYPYRDDALLLYEAIKRYVTNIVDLYYDTPEKLEGDFEMQAWADELVKPRDSGGCGILGVPGNGRFTSNDQLVLVLTSIISTCSLAHGAFNFPQYDAYGFCPNYPLMLVGKPPSDKEKRTEKDILKCIPSKPTTLDTMLITKLLSNKGTNSLGDFETNFVFDPKALEIVQEFKCDLTRVSKKINERNKVRQIQYEWLDPKIIPNSISI